MSELRLDSRDMKTRPCLTCENIISETAHERRKDQIEEELAEVESLSLDGYLRRF